MALHHFGRVWAERITDSARECVEIADDLYASDPKEARMYLARAEAFDKDDLARRIKELEALLEGAGKANEAADRLKKRKAARGSGNVVPLRAGEDHV